MPEYAFKILAFVLLLVYRVIRKVWEHRLSAHLKQEPVVVRKPLRERLVLGAMGVLMVPWFAWVIGPWLDFAHVPVPDWIRWGGGVITVLGIGYFASTHRALAHNWSPLLELREGNTLVTGGPYRLVRHPMYSAGFVVNIGSSILSANWLVAAGLVAGMLVVYAVRVGDEERMMLDAYGEQYREYMARTGRLAPRLSAVLGRERPDRA